MPTLELMAEVLALREQVAALESREVCAVAHDGDVTTCGYCQRDALRPDAERYRWLREQDWIDDAISNEYLIAKELPCTLDRAIDAAREGT